MLNLKKIVKNVILILGIILFTMVAAVLVFFKPLVMAVYNECFGIRFTTYEPLAWNIEDFDGLMRDRYTFESDKGQVLTAYKYYKDDTEAKGVVVLAHGYSGGGHRRYMDIADYFANNGYLVFAYDATGNDESEGEAVGGLPQGLIDLDYALRFLKSSPEFSELPIVLWGHSWGGYSVGTVMKLHPDVKAAIIVAGFNESLDMLQSVGRKYVGGMIDNVLSDLEEYEKEAFGEYASMSVLESLDATEASVMIIHSADDSLIPVEISYNRYYEKYVDNERFTFICYEDRGHSNVFCSEAMIKYVEEYNIAADAYFESVGEVTDEMRDAYYEENFDKFKGNELDSELMLQMLELYNRSI